MPVINSYDDCVGCIYYFGEIDQCMVGEEDVPDDLPKKCEMEFNPESDNSTK